MIREETRLEKIRDDKIRRETRRDKKRQETRRDKTRHERPRDETRQDSLGIAFSGLQNAKEYRCESNIHLIRGSHEP